MRLQHNRMHAWPACAILAGCVPCATLAQAPPPDPNDVIQYAARAGESVWRAVQSEDRKPSSRRLYTYALALCEAKKHLDRVPKLLELGAQMQDRDPNSSTYGNFLWYWKEDRIRDRNAVDFCMRGGSLLWLRHRDKLTDAARKTLKETIDYAVEGLIRHRVPTSYTNIALMNAFDLIVLGEAMGRPEVADEGYLRLERVCLYTWRWGTHEYVSPTYYGVDIECLFLIEAFCRRDEGRQQARALLELFFTDIALNWFPGNERLGGTCSREYRYLGAPGYVDTPLWMVGWLEGGMRGSFGAVFFALSRWRPPERLWELNRNRFPRLVEQYWGPGRAQYRTYYVCKDVGLSTSGEIYGWMALPLTVDLPGDRTYPRCYFIPDGRGDPYGKKKISTGAHRKAHHLRPFWVAAQRKADALGLTVYRRNDIVPECDSLQSHFVMPRDVDGFWIGERRVDLGGKEPKSFEVPGGEPVVLRRGTAAVGVRVAWSRGLDGEAAPAKLVYDGNKHGAVRLTVVHEADMDAMKLRQAIGSGPHPGAAFWMRIGSDLKTDEAFDKWRREFAKARAHARAEVKDVSIRVAANDGPIVLTAKAPYLRPDRIEPIPKRCVLALDGRDLGREILGDIGPVKAFHEAWAKMPTFELRPGEPVAFEAEDGVVLPKMVVGEDPAASGGQFVWQPGEPGGKGGAHAGGTVTWRVRVERFGAYYLWARVLAPTSDDDSFFVRVMSDSSPLLDQTEWHTGTHKTWEWTPLRLRGERKPLALSLRKGIVFLEFHTREDGTKLDRIFLTDSPTERPPK